MNNAPRRRPPALLVVAVVICLVLPAALLVRHYVTQPFHVPSSSMAPTLQAGDVLLVDRAARGTAQPGAVVVLDGSGYFADSAQATGSGYWVKRVVAVGGERVACCDDGGRITVDGDPLEEPYLADGTAPSDVPFDVEVPAGHVFVLGDNRAESADSRDHLGSPGGGMIPEDRIVGEVDRIVWPLPRWGAVPRLGSPR